MATAKLIEIHGAARLGSRLAVFVDGNSEPLFSTTADSAGQWSHTCQLSEGTHDLVATASLDGCPDASARTTLTVEADDTEDAGDLSLSERIEREALYAQFAPDHISNDHEVRSVVYAAAAAVGDCEELRDYIVRNGSENLDCEKAERICTAAGHTPEELFESVNSILSAEREAEFAGAVERIRSEHAHAELQRFRQRVNEIAYGG